MQSHAEFRLVGTAGKACDVGKNVGLNTEAVTFHTLGKGCSVLQRPKRYLVPASGSRPDTQAWKYYKTQKDFTDTSICLRHTGMTKVPHTLH
jgi:hypothetical protein